MRGTVSARLSWLANGRAALGQRRASPSPEAPPASCPTAAPKATATATPDVAPSLKPSICGATEEHQLCWPHCPRR